MTTTWLFLPYNAQVHMLKHSRVMFCKQSAMRQTVMCYMCYVLLQPILSLAAFSIFSEASMTIIGKLKISLLLPKLIRIKF
jgi:hypothetical protein